MSAKKKTETPVVEVTVSPTTTDVVEKPKRTRRKSATMRPSSEVLSEITERKEPSKETTTAVATILEKKKSKQSALRRIDDNGTVNLSDLSESELAEYIAIGKKLDVHDKMSISNYGSELSAQLNRSTKELMSLGRSTRLGDETSEIMQNISDKLMKIDLDDIKKPNIFVRTIRQIPLLNKMFFSVKKFLDKYDSMEDEVQKMQEKLQAAQAVALRDNNELEKRFQDTLSYIDVLEKLIVAAKIKSEEYDKAIQVMESEPEKYTAIAIHDVKSFKHELDKRISSMLTWHLSFGQSLFRIRDIQDANIAHSNAISESIENMMPQLRDQLHQAIVLYNLEQGMKAHDVMIEGFNEILKHNADAAHDMKVRITERTEKTAIDIETLRHNQQKIIETNKDVLRIMDEAAKQRLQNEREMAKMERELDYMLSGVDPAKAIESVEAIEAKYIGTDEGPH